MMLPHAWREDTFHDKELDNREQLWPKVDRLEGGPSERHLTPWARLRAQVKFKERARDALSSPSPSPAKKTPAKPGVSESAAESGVSESAAESGVGGAGAGGGAESAAKRRL